MESNTHCSDIKYFYLELLAFYLILIGLSGELFWNKRISKHVHKQVANKTASKICLIYTLSHQHILNLRQQFYKHRLDDKTIERIKELGLKRKFRGSMGGRNKARAWSSNKGVHQHLLQTLPKYDTRWNDTPIRMLLINIQSMKSKIDALLQNITLNDIGICLITETWIQTDQDLQNT